MAFLEVIYRYQSLCAIFLGRECPEMYSKTIERLGLYVSTQFNNWSNIKKCLKQGNIIRPVVPDLPEEHTAHEKRVWE